MARSLNLAALSTTALPILNMALGSLSFAITLRALQRISSGIAALDDHVSDEFTQDRELQSLAAFEVARDVLNFEHASNRARAIPTALAGLLDARIACTQRVLSILAQARSQPVDYQSAALLLTRAALATTSIVHCHLAIEEMDVARESLTRGLGVQRELTQQLVTALLGEHPALYLHGDVDDERVARALAVLQWLKHDKRQLDLAGLLATLHRLRVDFWSPGLVDSRVDSLRRPTGETSLPARMRRLEGLHLAESLIENLERLRGFELELRSMTLAGQKLGDW